MVSTSPLAAVSLGLGLLLAAVSPASAQSPTSTTTVALPPTAVPTSCTSGLQLFVARGSQEAPGLGRMGVVAGNITGKIPGSAVTAVSYPATFEAYFASVGNGTAAFGKLVSDYVGRCPDGKIALLGYSQGAQAAADLICGSSNLGSPRTYPLDSRYVKNIIAIILFGDPTRAANQSWNLGTVRDRNGLFPRPDDAACEPYASTMRSWCDAGDRYCDLGNITTVHGSYFNNYTDAATDFVVGQFNAAQSQGTPNTTASGGSGSSTTAGVPPSSSSPGSGAAGLGPRGGAALVAAVLGLWFRTLL